MLTKIIAVVVHFFSGEAAIVKKIQQHQLKRVAYWQLNNLSDKMLRDIGITRGDIRRVANGEWNGRRETS